MNTNDFSIRHIGPRLADQNAMLKTIGVESLDRLIFETIPDNIKLKKDLYHIAKDFDFAELCITSAAEVLLDNNLSEEISVETFKAEGEKCNVCWKIRKDKCERHGSLTN